MRGTAHQGSGGVTDIDKGRMAGRDAPPRHRNERRRRVAYNCEELDMDSKGKFPVQLLFTY